MNGHSLKLHFVCLKDHKGNMIVFIVIIFSEYFLLIAKFVGSKLHTNKNCFYLLKAFKLQKWIVLIFSNVIFFSQMCTIPFEN
jgi:hypothetical protein